MKLRPLLDDEVRSLVSEYEVQRPHHDETSRDHILGLLATLESLAELSEVANNGLDQNERDLLIYLENISEDMRSLCLEIKKLPTSDQRTLIDSTASKIQTRIQKSADRLRDVRRQYPYVTEQKKP